MTDLTADAFIATFGLPALEDVRPADSSAAQEIFKGSPLIIDQSADTANVRIFDSNVTLVATDVFVGISTGALSVALGDLESGKRAGFYTKNTIVGFRSTVFSAGDEGKAVYMSDSAVLTASAATNLHIGKVHKIIDGYVYVELDAPSIQAHI